MNDKIFISIPSYRDPELLPTLHECIEKADNPENLVFCIAWQHNPEDNWDNLDEYKDDLRFNVIDIDYKNSHGVCWARHLIQQHYQDEQYYLQLDSHHRFVDHWDTKCKTMIKQLQDAGYKKPLLTSYVASYDPSNDPGSRVQDVWKLDFDRFTPEGVVFMLPAAMAAANEKTMPVPTRFFSAHFAFTIGNFVKEVPYDPTLYFHGEEITLAVRAYTHGYDLFTPHIIVAWHEYTRKGRVRHWDENSGWIELNNSSLKLCKKLLGVDGEYFDRYEYQYGLGSERTLEDYERYAGIRFKDRSVQLHTSTNLDAPNPVYSSEEEYNKSFIRHFRHCIDVYKGDIEDLSWDAWAIIFEDANGIQLHREDAFREEILRIQAPNDSSFYNIWRQFYIEELPHHVIVWPYSFDTSVSRGRWGRKLEIKIPTV